MHKKTKLLLSLLAFALFIASAVVPVEAAGKPVVFTMVADAAKDAGIYLGTPDGKTKLKTVFSTPTKELTEGKDGFYFLGKPATKADFADKFYEFRLLVDPIGSAVEHKGSYYYTFFTKKEVYDGGSCGGGEVWSYQIKKVDSKGKNTVIITDEVPGDTSQFTILNDKIYYLKLTKDQQDRFQGYTLMQASLDGKTKKTIASKINNFIVVNNQLYVVDEASRSLFSLSPDGKTKKQITESNVELRNGYACDGPNYELLQNGFTVTDNSSDVVVVKYFNIPDKKMYTLNSEIEFFQYQLDEVDAVNDRMYYSKYDKDGKDLGIYSSTLEGLNEKQVLKQGQRLIRFDFKANVVYSLQNGKLNQTSLK